MVHIQFKGNFLMSSAQNYFIWMWHRNFGWTDRDTMPFFQVIRSHSNVGRVTEILDLSFRWMIYFFLFKIKAMLARLFNLLWYKNIFFFTNREIWNSSNIAYDRVLLLEKRCFIAVHPNCGAYHTHKCRPPVIQTLRFTQSSSSAIIKQIGSGKQQGMNLSPFKCLSSTKASDLTSTRKKTKIYPHPLLIFNLNDG